MAACPTSSEEMRCACEMRGSSHLGSVPKSVRTTTSNTLTDGASSARGVGSELLRATLAVECADARGATARREGATAAGGLEVRVLRATAQRADRSGHRAGAAIEVVVVCPTRNVNVRECLADVCGVNRGCVCRQNECVFMKECRAAARVALCVWVWGRGEGEHAPTHFFRERS
jgi:hypothetical protein